MMVCVVLCDLVTGERDVDTQQMDVNVLHISKTITHT